MALYLGSEKVQMNLGKTAYHLDVLTTTSILNKLPEEYSQVEYLKARDKCDSYIDLGFTFDTQAKIQLTQIINDTPMAYPFGAVEDEGALRCCLTSPYSNGNQAQFYGSNSKGFIGTSASIQIGINHFEMILKPNHLQIKNLTTNFTSGIMKTQGNYTMNSNLYLFAQNYNGTTRYGGDRIIKAFKYYDKNDRLVCDLIPCYHKNTFTLGMYDLVTGTFFTNAGTTPFLTTTIVNPNIKNLIPYSTENDGITIYNNGLGYKDGYRVRSGGAEAESVTGSCTGFIPIQGEDTVELTGYDVLRAAADNAINVYDASFGLLGQISATNNEIGYGMFPGAWPDYNWIKPKGIKQGASGAYTWKLPPDPRIAYIRVSGYTRAKGSNMIITINRM